MKVWRIGGGSHPVFAGEGARLFGGRWNSPGLAVIYCGSSFAICMLERLVWSGIGHVPKNDRYVTAEFPESFVENLDESVLPDWQGEGSAAARRFGNQWLSDRRSAVLSVPSAVTGIDRNFLVNPHHPDFGSIVTSDEQPVDWDRRLFGERTNPAME
ncbi:RES domain-containing protein (plasmid) [Skermanella rosea]|uniref:RES family NAD+ phosphorylase n=1 Tax=Skermanella rosea TaxID=1817965 RepID=UPI0019316C60|nr:RES domain-containing protein [Skermanella rosea]UEM07839.1 RES domain-containing protein [Skermanella rosea]